MTRAVVYDTETGEVVREMSGAVPLDKQRLDAGEELLVEGETPEREDAFEAVLPESFEGKKVDPSAREVVDDPDYSPPRPREEIRQDLKNGEITEREALLELLSGE